MAYTNSLHPHFSKFLSDEQWQRVKSLIEPTHVRTATRGGMLKDPRHVLDGIVWKLSRAAPWNALPLNYPSIPTCRKYGALWLASGQMHVVMTVLFGEAGRQLVDAQLVALRTPSILSNATATGDAWRRAGYCA